MSSFTKIYELTAEKNIIPDASMKEYTTFQAGGTADLLVTPENVKELTEILAYLKEENVPYFILGRGSNILVSDEGFHGVMISMRKNMKKIHVFSDRIVAEGGAMMPDIARAAMQNGLSGFEFASGIPGTIGGGVRMNAGAYGGEISQIIDSAVLLLKDGSFATYKKDGLKLSYRHSVIEELDAVVLSVELKLQPGDASEIKARMDELSGKRMEKQPLNFPSAGSTFKRPAGYFAAALIDEAGLKGFSVGDACVSEKHAGFVVNKGNAAARDIYELTEQVKEKVLQNSGVTLEREIILLGDF